MKNKTRNLLVILLIILSSVYVTALESNAAIEIDITSDSLESPTGTFIYVYPEPMKIDYNKTINVTLPYSMIQTKGESYRISFIGYWANWEGKSNYDNNWVVIPSDIKSKERLNFQYTYTGKPGETFPPIIIYFTVVQNEPPLIAFQEDIISLEEKNYKTNVYWITNNYNRPLRYAIDSKGNRLLHSLYLWDSELESKPDVTLSSDVLEGEGITTKLLTSGVEHQLNKDEFKNCDNSWIEKLGYPFDCKTISWNRNIIPKISDYLLFQMDYQLSINTKYKINSDKSSACVTPTGFIFPEINLPSGNKYPRTERDLPTDYFGDCTARIVPTTIGDTSFVFYPAWWNPPNSTFDENQLHIKGMILNGPYSKLNANFKLILERPIYAYIIFFGLLFAFIVSGYYGYRSYKFTYNKKTGSEAEKTKKQKIIYASSGAFILFYILEFTPLRSSLGITNFSPLFDLLPVIGLILAVLLYKIKH
jgi:hypothetical protein